MALIRQAEFERVAMDGVALNLGDLRAQGEAIVRAAREEAARIVSAARAERERLIAGARDEGFRKGQAEGLAAGREQGRKEGLTAALGECRERFKAIAEGWEGALSAWNREREEMMQAGRTDVVRLAALLAEKVTKRRLELDPGLVTDVMSAALEAATASSEAMVVVHPEDEGLVREALPGVARAIGESRRVSLATDASLSRGSCVVRTRGGAVEATIEGQLSRMAAALLPGHGAPGPKAGGEA